MELMFLASESTNFLSPITFLAVLPWSRVNKFANDDEFGIFVEIMSLLLKNIFRIEWG